MRTWLIDGQALAIGEVGAFHFTQRLPIQGQVIPRPRIRGIGFDDLLEVSHGISEPFEPVVDRRKPELRFCISWIEPAGFL
ncbi:MAG TPA: hypothetical protein VEW05_06800 [Candidatus Polarisedimenticolia bacterium]|nr:hypothetical protein [Candidatus Polarisedimenticolia bacterium]